MTKEEYACTEECTEFIEKVMKDLETPEEGGPYWLHEKYGAKVKYFKSKKGDDLIDQLIKEQPTYKKGGGHISYMRKMVQTKITPILRNVMIL